MHQLLEQVWAAENRYAKLREVFIASSVIRVHVCVHQETQRSG